MRIIFFHYSNNHFKLHNTTKPIQKPDKKEEEESAAIEVPYDKKQSKISDITVKVTDTKNSKQLLAT